jgi:hypothetical protein
MSEYKLPQCAKDCIKNGKSCDKSSCRMWIDYEEDSNCSLVCVQNNGPMTLDEVSKRLKISLVRVSQIEKQALGKLSKRIKT